MSNKIERQVFSKILPMVLETFVQPKGPFLNMQSFPSLHYQQQYSTKDVNHNLCCFSGKLAMLTWTCIYDRTMQEYGQAFDYTLTLPCDQNVARPRQRKQTDCLICRINLKFHNFVLLNLLVDLPHSLIWMKQLDTNNTAKIFVSLHPLLPFSNRNAEILRLLTLPSHSSFVFAAIPRLQTRQDHCARVLFLVWKSLRLQTLRSWGLMTNNYSCLYCCLWWCL